MNFAQHANKYTNYTRTENKAVALRSTESALLDLFATVGALRGKNQQEVGGLFQSAFNEDKLLATKLMFYARNIRGGLGERDTFRKMLFSLANTNPEIVGKNIDLIPHFGRWDDIYVLADTPAEEYLWPFIKEQFRKDCIAMVEEKNVSLMAKWLKSVNTSSKESCELGKRTAKALGMSEKTYRKLLSQLRRYIDVVEKKMSQNKWQAIDYEKVPSNAMKNYRNAFKRHDENGFESFIEDVKSGDAKINASTLYPYDILMRANIRSSYYGGWGSRHGNFAMDKDAVLEEQWKALPNYIDGENNVLVMADTSGSMEMEDGRPLATSLGLAIYFAERNKGAYKDLFLTFSESPRFVKLQGNTLAEKVSKIEAIVENTNLEKAFELILDVALTNNVSQDEMPKSLIIITDMHFDQAQGYSTWSGTSIRGSQTSTFYEKMKEKFADNGYEIPTIIFWNVAQRQEAFQVTKDEENVLLVSGQSTSTFKGILGNIGATPYDFMVETLNDEMYDCVTV